MCIQMQLKLIFFLNLILILASYSYISTLVACFLTFVHAKSLKCSVQSYELFWMVHVANGYFTEKSSYKLWNKNIAESFLEAEQLIIWETPTQMEYTNCSG